MNQPAREYMRGRCLEEAAMLRDGKPCLSIPVTPIELLSLLDEADDRDRLLADLAKAREEYMTVVDAIAASTDGAGHAATLVHRMRRERDELKAKLAALEARAADARMVCEWLTGDSDDKEPREAAFEAAHRYLANAPAPAKADDAWMSRALDGPEIRDDAHADAILAEAGIDPVKALAKTMEMAERYELAAQLAEAVELLRRWVDRVVNGSLDGSRLDDTRTFLDAIDAGRARAKETK